MEIESKLIPVMREGVEIIKMILYSKLKEHLAEKYPQRSDSDINRLSAAIINELFFTQNPDETFVVFVAANKDIIDKELRDFSTNLKEFTPPLTDALRMEALCDNVEGHDSVPALQKAEELGILVKHRDLPLPHKFMDMVRRLGSGFGLIIPPTPTEGQS